ncbi:hypothetical protein SASPL_131417 [Salvia splendens]|uniref:Uncharacterized protein n=1 Tax=Salvia splendens TaxID=180675 RepID=A0A8X8XAY2_SALSN|nr:hypothetical protein SASPL_131417 [Salvia splendens]
MNFLKHFWIGDEPERKEMKTRLFGADPPVLYVLHYLGDETMAVFSGTTTATGTWTYCRNLQAMWRTGHGGRSMMQMPEKLQKYCLLRSKQKAALEWDRRQAEKEACCGTGGDKNWTDNSTATLPQPPPSSAQTASYDLWLSEVK